MYHQKKIWVNIVFQIKVKVKRNLMIQIINLISKLQNNKNQKIIMMLPSLMIHIRVILQIIKAERIII